MTLSDGPLIQMREEVYNTLLDWLEDAFDDNDQEVLVEIHGYKSKSTGSVSNITLNIVFYATIYSGASNWSQTGSSSTCLDTERLWCR